MKITVEPDDGQQIDTLDDLATLVSRAQAMVAASRPQPAPEGQRPVQARVRLAVSAKVKSIEVSW